MSSLYLQLVQADDILD